MSRYEEGLRLLEEMFGGGRDSVLALATVAREPDAGGKPTPAVRAIDVYYEDGVFYAVTYGQSNKMRQIAENSQVAIAFCSEMVTANGTGENLGWVLEPQNAAIRDKLRAAFAGWYDMANDENDRNCCILAIRLKNAVLNINHWEKLYHMDFVNGSCLEDGAL